MRDYRSNVIMARNKRLGDCLILIVECEAVREAILMAIQEVSHGLSSIMISVGCYYYQWKDRISKRYYKLKMRNINYVLTRFSDCTLEFVIGVTIGALMS